MPQPRFPDVVSLKRDRPEDGLRAGNPGTISDEYQSAREAYEVEFVNDGGEVIALVTLVRDEFAVVVPEGVRAAEPVNA